MVTYTKIHSKFKLNNTHYTFNGLKEVVNSLLKETIPFKKSIADFLVNWLDDNSVISLATSGSTGKPKTLEISKQAMVNSSIATGQYFNLKPSDKALLCLPASYIAGKMMLVRAMVLGLELDIIKPETHLKFNDHKKYHFVAMVPMQLEACIDYITNIEQLIVGGAPVSNKLKAKLKDINTNVFETYGMTETVSHIAVKQLNNLETASNYFKILPDVKISQDKRDCLVVEAPKITSEKVITNDVVKLQSKNSFKWLGRYDNVINSGGIKLFPEQIEEKLKSKIQTRFFIASQEDETLGQALILVIEGEGLNLSTSAFNELGTYEKPKRIYYIPQFSETSSGKIQRKKTLNILKTKD